LRAQEQEVLYDLAQAVAEMDRGFVVLQTNYNRMIAAREQVAAVQAAFDDDRIQFIAVLDAQRRQSEDEAQYYRSRVEYAVAIKNVHFEKGTMLDYLGIATTEGPWPDKAYDDAARREASRGFFWSPRGHVPIVATDSEIAVESPYPVQELLPPGAVPAEPMPMAPPHQVTPQQIPQQEIRQPTPPQQNSLAAINPVIPSPAASNYGWQLNRPSPKPEAQARDSAAQPPIKPASYDQAPPTRSASEGAFAHQPEAQARDSAAGPLMLPHKPEAQARGPAAGLLTTPTTPSGARFTNLPPITPEPTLTPARLTESPAPPRLP
jgi:hypothetical protein